jgi:hypothetical protein
MHVLRLQSVRNSKAQSPSASFSFAWRSVLHFRSAQLSRMKAVEVYRLAFVNEITSAVMWALKVGVQSYKYTPSDRNIYKYMSCALQPLCSIF